MSARYGKQHVIRKIHGCDIISHLPSHIIDHILTCMPLRDAVRTCILSHEWRYKWVKLPKLAFDNRFGKVQNLVSSRYKLLLSIFQVLLAHEGPIHVFVLSVPGLESCAVIDQFLHLVSKKGVQKFALEIWKGKHHVLHSSLFLCLQLTHLELRRCVFKPLPSFKGFSELVHLSLCEVITDDDKLSSLISHCPLLERFEIECLVTCDYLEVCAPNLKFLRCNALFETVIYVTAPLLANVSMSLKVLRNKESFEEEWTMLELLGFRGVLENLHLDYYYLKSLFRGDSCFTLDCLKVLKLSAICFGMTNEVTCVMLLIRNCPSLQKITVEAYPSEEGLTIHDVEFYEGLHFKDLSFCQVREVEMLHLSGSWTELEFIKFMLGKLPLLEKMVIEPDLKMVADGGFKILKEVAQFQRASPRTIIKFKNQ